MRIIDSNILIYSYSDVHKYLRPLLLESDIHVSEITRLEVLGFHGLSREEEVYLTEVFLEIQVIEINSLFMDEAIRLRKTYKMKLGDSIVAATAVLNGLELYTRNVADFNKIPGLVVVNPVL